MNKNCRLSYGIICIKNKNVPNAANMQLLQKLQNKIALTKDEISNFEILMIRGKHSYNYIEFIMGKYEITNIEYIINLMSEITINEKQLLLENRSFEYLWKELWNIPADGKIDHYVFEFQSARTKYESILNGFFHNFNGVNIRIQMQTLLDLSFPLLDEPIWGFPKGKRDVQEIDLTCALREFTEETNIPTTSIRILPIQPIQEYYKASNKKFYCNVYYIAEYIGNPEYELEILETNIHQQREIGDIQWVPWYQSYDIIRNNYIFRKNILYQLELIFKNIHS